MAMKISVFIYEHGEIVDKTVEKFIGPSLEYVEDLIIDICRERNIGPIARYLFSLYCPKMNLWLAMNQKLNELDYNCKFLQLRLKYKPYDLRKLVVSKLLISSFSW